MTALNASTRFAMLAASAAATLAASSALAGVVYDTNTDVWKVDGATTSIISGSGIRYDHFSTDSEPALLGAQPLSVAVKPRNRDIVFDSEANFITNNNYYDVNPGQSANNPARPQLVFDLQFSPGNDAVTNYVLRLMVDFNPASGEAAPSDYSVVQLPIFGGWNASDGFFVNGTGGNGFVGPWNNPTVPYVISNTTNLSFLPPPTGFTYNSNTLGEYEVKLEVLDPTATNVLASATAFAVVPEPTSIGVAAIAGVGLINLRRRRCANA